MRKRATSVSVGRDEVEALRKKISHSRGLLRDMDDVGTTGAMGLARIVNRELGEVESMLLSLIERAKGGPLPERLLAARGARQKD